MEKYALTLLNTTTAETTTALSQALEPLYTTSELFKILLIAMLPFFIGIAFGAAAMLFKSLKKKYKKWKKKKTSL